jgi:plastocyanin
VNCNTKIIWSKPESLSLIEVKFARIAIALVYACLAPQLPAGSLDVTVRDSGGALVANAVVYAKKSGATSARAPKQAAIDQRNKQFVPYVTAVQVGTAIWFPNSDNIRHHVYSLSPAKRFELPLYAGSPAAPVVFDKEGFVTLGCNIHDWMIAYVAVLPTPHFSVSDQSGRASLRNLPAGHYTVLVWQPSLKGAPERFAQVIDLADMKKELSFTLPLKPDFRAQRAPALSTGGYP